MIAIYKYAIGAGPIDMPVGARVIKAGMQNEGVMIWAIVDTDSSVYESRHFVIYGTGHRIYDLDALTFIDTVFDGIFVWHIFERKS